MTFCFRLPTVFLAECVLVYMEPEKSAAIIDWAGTNFKTALFINYEQVSLICSLVGEGYEALCEERGGGWEWQGGSTWRLSSLRFHIVIYHFHPKWYFFKVAPTCIAFS